MKSISFYIAMMAIMVFQNASAMDSKIFSDDFNEPAAEKWNDMAGWGFGVWQVENGMFVSFDSTQPTKQMYAALPKFENAVLAQDYRAVFRFKPVSAGGTLQLTINVRQQGLDAHKIEISNDGAISLIRAESGKWPKILTKSAPGVMKYDVWQWLRLDVCETNRLSMKVKIWRGEISDEPDFYDVIAVDPGPLRPTNLNVALVTMQTEGAYVAVDAFDIYSTIPGSGFWKWISESDQWDGAMTEKMEQVKKYYDRGKYWDCLKIMETLDAENDPALINNQAIVRAEWNDFGQALTHIRRAKEMAANQPEIQANANWMWYAAQFGGLLKPIDGERPSLVIKPKKNVLKDAGNLELAISVCQNGGEADIVKISVLDDQNQVVLSQEVSVSDSAISMNVAELDDGTYRVLAQNGADSGEIGEAETSVEIIRHSYQNFARQLNDLTSEIQKLRADWQHDERIFDLANVGAELTSVQLALADCDAPGLLELYRSKIEQGLELAGTHLKHLTSGSRPFHHQKGSYMRGYVSEIDSSLQGYAVFCPDTYQPDNPFPLVINLHGYDPSYSRWQENPFLPVFMPFATAGGRYIVANPFGRGNAMYQHLGENDVLRVLAEVKRLYHIDENRIYLVGGSMGGCGTWNIGLSYPDLFAAIAPIMGPTEFSFWNGPERDPLTSERKFINARYSSLTQAKNALNMPVFCNHGVEDDIVPVEQSRVMVARFKELGYPIKYVEHEGVAHGGFDPQMDYDIYDWFENKQRNSFPERVVYKSADLKHNSAYWITIHQFIDLLNCAEIDARIHDKNEIDVRTKNVAQFSIDLNKQLFSIDDPLRVKINGVMSTVDFSDDQEQVIFYLIDEKWSAEKPAKEPTVKKTSQLAGPMIEAFNSGFIVVYGTDGREQMADACRQEALDFSDQWKEWQHVPCRIKSDRDVTAQDMQQDNLILIGNADCNRIVARLNESLPIRCDDKSIRIDDEQFTTEHVGCAFIYPNPLNPARYVLIMAGNSAHAVYGITRRIGFDFDYVIFDNRTMGLDIPQGNLTIDGTPLRYGFFDQQWKLTLRYQFRSDMNVRSKIKPRMMPIHSTRKIKKSTAYLSDMKPDGVTQLTGHPQFDRTFWGEPFSQDRGKGIGVFPNSELTYILNGAWDVFTADLSAAMRPFIAISKSEYNQGKIQFGIYGDDRLLFVSNVMDVNSEQQHVEVPVRGVRVLKLIVRTQDWIPYFAQSANWGNARLERRN